MVLDLGREFGCDKKLGARNATVADGAADTFFVIVNARSVDVPIATGKRAYDRFYKND